MEESLKSSEIRDDIESFAFRTGNIFIVDVAPEMFELDPASNTSYFQQCLHMYASILSQKLAWNKRDWTGLVFYNATKNWDKDPETKNVLTIHKFAEVNADMLREIINIKNRDNNQAEYCDPSKNVELDRCLDDVLWQSCRSFDCIKIAMPLRQVVLLTRRDNPLPDDTAERHKIRLRAKTFHDANIKLQIVGLGNDWNHELFYKDIDVLANNIKPEDSKPQKIDDFEILIKFPARTSGHLNWRLYDDMEIPLVVSSFSSKTKFLKTARMDQDTNEILDAHRHWGSNSQDHEDSSSDEEDEEASSTRVPDNVSQAVICGETTVTFGPEEMNSMQMTSEMGIDLIGFKPIAWNLEYHIKPPRFVGLEDTTSDEKKALFAALLKGCITKNVMAICAVSHRASPYLARMIPCPKYSGFYLYKTAFKEQVNDLRFHIQDEVFDSVDEDSLPIDEAGVDLMTKIISKLKMNWDPFAFTNPILTRQLAYLEALAMDMEFVEPADSTCPNEDQINQRLGNLVQSFEEMFELPTGAPTKRECSETRDVKHVEKKLKVDDDLLRSLIQSGKLSELKVDSLKVYARSIGVQTTGLKVQLVERITEYYARKDRS